MNLFIIGVHYFSLSTGTLIVRVLVCMHILLVWFCELISLLYWDMKMVHFSSINPCFDISPRGSCTESITIIRDYLSTRTALLVMDNTLAWFWMVVCACVRAMCNTGLCDGTPPGMNPDNYRLTFIIITEIRIVCWLRVKSESCWVKCI